MDDTMKQNIEEELAQCEKEREEYLNGWKRAKADFVNYQREQERLQKSLLEYANAVVLEDVLSLYDSVVGAVKHSPSGNNGWQELLKQFQGFLKNHGVEPIKAVGERADPHFHEVVDTREEGSVPGIVVAEVQTGFLLKGKVLRTSKVVVSKLSKSS